MKSGRKNKKLQSPKTERTSPYGSLEEAPASPGRPAPKSGFLSRFRTNKPLPPEPIIGTASSSGRITPEQSESRASSEKQKSQNSSPKSITIGLASSTYRNLSQSLTDLAGIGRTKSASPDLDSVPPPLPSPFSPHAESPPLEKPIVLPFRPETIQRQGWLNKRPESDLRRPRPGANTVWKLQRAILHDSRLYLYNPPSSLGIKSFSPSSTPVPSAAAPSQPSASHIKHAHSPSEGVALQINTAQASLQELGPRPSTAPHGHIIRSEKPEPVPLPPDAIEQAIDKIRLDDEERIVGGSVTAICYHILCTHSVDPSDIDEDCRVFCTTVGFWAPVELVLQEMTRIASKKNVVARLDAIVRYWCDNTPRILWEEGANEALLVLVEEGVTSINDEKGHTLSNYVLETEKRLKGLLHPFTKGMEFQEIDEVDVSGLLEHGLTGAVLLNIPTEVVAEQVFIFHLKYLMAVDPAQDMSLLLDRSSPPRSRSPLVFSPQSQHFLTRLVYTHVLGLDIPDASLDVPLRAKFLSRWIEIGQSMKARGDLSGFLAIAEALLSIPILRLKETWTDVDIDLRGAVIRDWSPMMRELYRRELGADVGPWTAHVLTPDLKREDLDSHLVIPYYGDICTALESFEIWAVASNTDVDFLQVREAFSGVEHAISRWNSFKLDALGEHNSLERFFSRRHKGLQNCFEDLHISFADGFPYSAEQIFEASVQMEPPQQGAYIEHHYAKRLSVTSGSYVPLMLTDLLPSYKLFDQTDLLEALSTVDKRILYSTSQSASRQHRDRPTSPGSSAWTGPTRENKPSPLRRTNSYPPSRTSLATTGNANLDYSTHNRIAGLTSRHFPMLRILRDIAGVEQSLLHVQDGELVLKVATDARRLSRPGSMIIETSSKRASMASKRSSIQIFGTPTVATPPASKLTPSGRNSFLPDGSTPAIDVVTKAGSLDRLVDVLVLGIEDFSTYIIEDHADPNGKRSSRLQMNIDEFRTTFLATFRSFCSPTVLLEYLRKRFIGAVFVAAHINEDEGADDVSESFPDWTPIEPLDNDKVDWQLVGKIQCGVLDTISVWISQYFSDFLDTPNLGMEMVRLLRIVQHELLVWDEVYKTKPYVTYFSTQIGCMAKGIRKVFAATFYKPTYYPSSFRTPEHFLFRPAVPPTMTQGRADRFVVLFNELDESLLRLYQQVSTEDWMAAFELFEVQSTDICGFYNPNASSSTREEDIRLRTLFTIIAQLQRPRGRGPLFDALPRSLRYLHRLHENLVLWITAQISDTSIGLHERSGRIHYLLNFLRSSRQRMSYLDFYSSEKSVALAEEKSEKRLGVPSFIASAVAAALVSPESRIFSRAWAKVLEAEDPYEQCKSHICDTLSEIVNKQPAVLEHNTTRTLTPCLGWIMERMLEIACYVPNMSLESTRLINFDKRRYIFNLISNIVPATDDFELMETTDQPLSHSSFAFQLISSDLSDYKPELRAMREVASYEWDQYEHRAPKIFRTHIADEQRKNRRDQRRRADIEKQLREYHKSRPLGIREAPSQPDLREVARSGRDAKGAKGARGMFLRTIRPLSLAIGSNPFGDKEKTEARIVKATELPKMMSIPPGTRAAAKLSVGGALILDRGGFEKEHVFSIRTEEGQECWLQGLNAQDASGWVETLTSIAAQRGPTKSKEITPEPPKIVKAADPVFGVKLEFLLEREGKDVPCVVEKLLNDIERRGMVFLTFLLTIGMDEVGLYRVPGSVSSIKALISALDSGEEVDMDDERWIDINVVAGTFKSWLRELPESILTPALYDQFIAAVGINDYEEKCYTIKNLVYQLPKGNFNLLKRVIEHLKRVADNESVNHMNALNLAICLAPIIVTATGPALSFSGTIESMGRAQGLVRDLILQCEWVFGKDEEVNEETVENEESGAGNPKESLEVHPTESK